MSHVYNFLFPIYDYYYVFLREYYDYRYAHIVRIKRNINHIMFLFMNIRFIVVLFGYFHGGFPELDYTFNIANTELDEVWLNILFAMFLTLTFMYYMSDYSYSFPSNTISGSFFYNFLVLNHEAYVQSLKTKSQILKLRQTLKESLNSKLRLRNTFLNRKFLSLFSTILVYLRFDHVEKGFLHKQKLDLGLELPLLIRFRTIMGLHLHSYAVFYWKLAFCKFQL